MKEQVEARWREQEIATRLNAKATEILDKLKAGTPFADVAAASRPQGRDHDRHQARQGSGAAFGRQPSTRSSAPPRTPSARPRRPQPAEQVVFRVTEIVVPSLDAASDDAKRVVETLNRGLSEDILGEYIAKLESEIGVTINQSALNQVVGGGTGDNVN